MKIETGDYVKVGDRVGRVTKTGGQHHAVKIVFADTAQSESIPRSACASSTPHAFNRMKKANEFELGDWIVLDGRIQQVEYVSSMRVHGAWSSPFQMTSS